MTDCPAALDTTRHVAAAGRLLQGGALLAATAAQYTSAVDALEGQALIRLDAAGRIASWDATAERVFRYAAEEVVGRHFSTFYAADEAARGLPERALTLARGTGRHYEQGRRVGARGSTFWAGFLLVRDASGAGEPGELLLVVTDLTAARAADEQIARLSTSLRERTAEYETLLNVMPVGIGVALDPACQTIQVNRVFADALGITPGQNASKTAPDGERPNHFRCLDDQGNVVPDDQLPMQVAAREGRELNDVELNIVHDDGRVVRLLEYAAPLLDEQGRPRGSVGAFVDITQRSAIARRHQFLMALDDALRPLTDAQEITAAAARMLGQYLQVARCGYADVEEDQNTFNVTGDYTVGVPTTVGRYQISDFGDEVLAAMRENRPYIADDWDSQRIGHAEVHAFMRIRASVVVPLHKQGRLVAMMGVHHDRPRHWTEAEVELLQHVASRSWESIERTKVARRLRESEARFRQLVDAVADYAIFMLDPQGCVSSWNNGAARITGYSAEEALGRRLSYFYTPEERSIGKPERVLTVAADQGRYEEEGRRTRKDGSQFWASTIVTAIRGESGSLRGFANVTRDVTERKRAEEMFRLAVQSAASSIMLLNQQGTIVFANQPTEDLFGYRQEELIGRPFEMLIPDRYSGPGGDPTASGEEAPAFSLSSGRELRARRRDGTEFPMEIDLNPIETEEGILILTSIVDITARRQAAAREREQLAQLAHAGRLASLGEMLSELTHEINQPLAAATNYARACLRYARAPDGVSVDALLDLVGKIAAQTERAGAIVKRLTQFVRKSPPTQAPIRLNDLVRDMIALTAPGCLPEENAARGVVVETSLDETLPPVLVDRVQIEQVLVNLFRNALDAMEDCPARQRVLRIQTGRSSEQVLVSVSDRGAGIAPEHLPRLFEPFFTTKLAGVGLGLSISRSIIEAHGGKITVHSRPQEGATFSFTLPVALDVSPDASPDGFYR